jgi:surface antigen
VPSHLLRQSRYRGSLRARLRRLPAGALALSLALTSGACSYQLESMLGKGRDDGGPQATSALRPSPVVKPIAELAEADLVIARATVSEALTKGGKDTSMPWENPKTGARGTVTPLASAYNQNGLTCQDFLASYVRNGAESWLQGEACRLGRGQWEVRHMKPWQRT